MGLARVGGVPFAGEALGFAEIFRGELVCNFVARLDFHVVPFTRWPPRGATIYAPARGPARRHGRRRT